MKKLLITLLGSLFLFFASSAQAQTTFYGADDPRGALTNSNAARTAFQSALLGFGTDNIEAYAGFTPNPSLTFGATGITATTNLSFVADFTGNPFNLAISGVKAVVDDAALSDTFNFNTLINAFGFYVTQAGDAGNTNNITITLNNTNNAYTKSFNLGTFGPNFGFDNVFYFGVIDVNQFNQLVVTESSDGDGILFDDITAGFTAVPEPGSLVLGSCVLAGLATGTGLYFRRKRKLAEQLC